MNKLPQLDIFKINMLCNFCDVFKKNLKNLNFLSQWDNLGIIDRLINSKNNNNLKYNKTFQCQIYAHYTTTRWFN